MESAEFTSYSIGFTSVNGKLRFLGRCNGKVVKTKMLNIMATKKELARPSPELERVLTAVRMEFDHHYKACYGTQTSPLNLMFKTQFVAYKTASDYFDGVLDARVCRFKEFIGNDLGWGDVTDGLLRKYRQHLVSMKLAGNSVLTYLNGVKKHLKAAREEGYLFSAQLDSEALSYRAGESIAVVLNMEEVRRIMDVPLEGVQELVRSLFVVGLLTGARYSDFCNLSVNNVVQHNGRSSLCYVSQKTGKKVSVPLHPELPPFLERIRGAEVSVDKMNRELPRIAKLAGISAPAMVHRGDRDFKGPKWRYVKSHTARRSFATNIYLSGEFDVYRVQELLGHRSITTTERYLQGVYRSNFDRTWSYFERYAAPTSELAAQEQRTLI